MRFTRIAKYQNLLLEADIIKVGNDMNAIAGGDNDSEQKKKDAFDKIDAMLDDVMDKNIADYLSNGNFINAFTADSVINTVNEYLAYCKARIIETKGRVVDLMKSGIPSADEVRLFNVRISKIQERIELLNEIYARAKNEKLNATMDILAEVKREINDYYMTPIRVKSEMVKTELGIVKTGDDVAKVEAANKIYVDFVELEEIAEEYPDEVKAGINSAKETAQEEIKQNISEEDYDEIMAGNKANIFFTKIVKDILEFEQLYGTEAEIKETARLLRNVRITNNPNLDGDSKLYLISWVNQIEATLLKKAQDKSIKLDMNKGIHYDFNIKLPLFKTVMIPVTGKQIADNTFLMRARKKAISVIDLLFGGMPLGDTVEYDAFKNLGKTMSQVYSVVLNRTAKVIGKALNGREGEMKADAISRQFMPTQEFVDARDAKKTNEDSVGPGSAMQVPGSTGSMGPITPPTQNSIGSGDDFSPKKKRKIMEFAEFLKNKNN